MRDLGRLSGIYMAKGGTVIGFDWYLFVYESVVFNPNLG